ncbi:hypothetical protein IWW50_004861 [Coemansia erecta]|nr:hypothetical protein IWW50_004861 [Coemansia erecta]
MGTCADQLRSISDETHAQKVLSTTKWVLYLRTTTQIDELMQHASVAVQQRWDFLGPSMDPSQPPSSHLFEQIDNALQWTANAEVGEYIRHSHFSLELTEDQAEVVCAGNVRYYFADRESAHAMVPFVVLESKNTIYVVDLLWEDGKWVYFDTKAVDKLSGFASIAAAIDDAASTFLEAGAGADDDDDYWGQYSDDGDDGDDGGASNQNPAPKPDHAANPEPQTHPGQLITDSIRHALAAAASAAKAIGMSEPEFLELAANSYK